MILHGATIELLLNISRCHVIQICVCVSVCVLACVRARVRASCVPIRMRVRDTNR